MRIKVLGFALFTVATLAGVIVIPGLGVQEQKRPAQSPRRVFDENRFPIADFAAPEPKDPNERSKRRLRGQKYDKSSWFVNPESRSDSMVRVDAVDQNLPAFPINESKAVIIGRITEAHAFLSNDKTGIYSVFTVGIEEVLQNSSNASLTQGTLIEVEREGGRVRFPSGKLHLYMIAEQNMPHVSGRYVLFLTDGNDQPVFQILTGYELREGLVYSLDDLRNSRVFEKTSEATFLDALRMKIACP